MAGPVKRKSTGSNLNTSRKKLKLVTSSFQFHDLNDDCLIYVFKGFDLITLAKMARTCKRFYGLILTHVIPFRTIDFSAFRNTASVRNMFDLFGKSMTRIVVHQDDIQTVFPGYTQLAEFLRLLVEYGQPGQLKQVKLTFGGWNCHVPGKLLQDVGPYFANVQKLEFNFTKNQMRADQFAEFFVAIHKQNLRELHLHNVDVIADWLSPELLADVQKIHLCLNRRGRHFFWNQQFHHDRDAFNENRLIHFLARKPRPLIDFECVDAVGDGIFVELSRRSPEIERLSEIRDWTIGNNNNNNNNGGMNGIQRRWEYLNAFTNLKDLSLKSSTANFSDLGKVFSILAKRQTIEQLQLTMGLGVSDQGNPVQMADLKRLTRLKTLHLIDFDDNRSKEFVNLLFANLPALTSCTIEGKHPKQDRIIELIKSAPNLKVLKFDGKFTSFSVPFYKKLVKCRAPPDGQDASEEKRLMVYVDRDSVQKCLTKLGSKRYKPSIVMVQEI